MRTVTALQILQSIGSAGVTVHTLKQSDCSESAHHRHVTQERVSCICDVSLNQASPQHCEKLIFVDGVLCTLPWAGWAGIAPGEAWSVLVRRGDNYQTRSRQQRHKSRFDFLTAGRLRRMVPLSDRPAHPDSLLITPERQRRLVP